MNYDQLLDSIIGIHERAQAGAAAAVNHLHVLRNWIIGAYVIEYEQNGKDRAHYGTGLLRQLSIDLTERGLKGCSPDGLERMRQLYRAYPQLKQAISATPLRKFSNGLPRNVLPISATPLRKSLDAAPPPLGPEFLLRFSWSKLLEFLRLEDPWKRRQTKVEFATAGMDNHLFVSRYLVALPKPEELQALIERDRAHFDTAAVSCGKARTSRRLARPRGKA